ncbi:MAG TPA: hypothetical protein VH475_23535 [Tepidisphaeraceae bacterium]|jgi:LmbE family N-acetylglucosaminyl deacetylase
MIARAKDFLRRRVRGWQRRGQYPLRLPQEAAPDARWRQALEACDGRRTLAEVAREAGLSRAQLIEAHDQGLLLIWRSPVPPDAPRLDHPPHAIICSPHPDDAALSCGGRMLGDRSILVLNAFSRTAWWRFGYDVEDLPRIQACRSAEEALVSRLSGCPVRNLDLPEALLRGRSMADLFTAMPDARDAEVSVTIGEAVRSLGREYPLAHWYLPLAVGDHLDHRIARDAALAALREQGAGATHLHFYEDLPYAAKAGPAADFSTRVPGLTLGDEPLDVDDAIGWKLELLRAYRSQFRWAELAELRSYAKAVGGGPAAEITWTPT